jgi:hypothetical protein
MMTEAMEKTMMAVVNDENTKGLDQIGMSHYSRSGDIGNPALRAGFISISQTAYHKKHT